jgi:hypothetical protein
MIPLPEYIDLDFEHADFGILQRGKNEPIAISWDPGHRCHVAISATTPEVYYKVDLLCDGSGFCTCPSFKEVQSKKHRPCKHIIALDLQIAKKGNEEKK